MKLYSQSYSNVIDYYQLIWRAAPTAIRGVMVLLLGAALGLISVLLAHFPAQTAVIAAAGALLLIFPFTPAGFLLAYLACLPLLDMLIPFFTTRMSDMPFGPQILLRGGIIVLLVYYCLVNQTNPLAFRPAVPMFMLLFLLVLSTLTSGIRTQLGVVSLAKVAYWMFLLPTVADMVARGRMKLETIYRCVIISTLGFMFIVLAAPIIGVERGSYYGVYGVGDARGPFAPHSLALCLSMGLIVALALCAKQQNRFRLLLLLLLGAAITVSVARTYARTGYTALFTSLLVFTLMVWRYGRMEAILRRHRLILGMAFVVIIGAFCVYNLVYSETFRHRISDLSNIETAGSGRMMIYEAGLTRYANFSPPRWIFGGGFGATHYLLGDPRFVPHNEYLLILLAGGLLGLAFCLWFVVSLWKQIRSTARGTYVPLIVANSVIATLLVASTTNPVIGYASVMTYFSFLVGGTMGYYARRTPK